MNDSDSIRRPREIALAQEAAFELADTHVSPAALEVEHAGRVTALEPRVMKVLVALSRANGQPVSRDDLTLLCWGGRVVTDGALNRCVAQLRKALSGDARIQLETIATVGYRLQIKPTVQQALPETHAAPVENSFESRAPAAIDLATAPTARKPLWRRTGLWYLGGAVLALIAVGA